MMIPLWAIVLVSVLLVVLIIWSVLAAAAWGGAQLQLRELQAKTKLLQIDIYHMGQGPPAPFGDRGRLSADRDGRSR